MLYDCLYTYKRIFRFSRYSNIFFFFRNEQILMTNLVYKLFSKITVFFKISKSENHFLFLKIWKYLFSKSENIKLIFQNRKSQNNFRNLKIFCRIIFFFFLLQPFVFIFFYWHTFAFFCSWSEKYVLLELRGKHIFSIPSCQNPDFVLWVGTHGTIIY